MNKLTLYNMAPIPHNVLEDPKFIAYRPSVKVLYLYLAKLQNRLGNGWFWRSERKLHQDTGLDVKTIRAAKNDLFRDDFIQIKGASYDPKIQARHACHFLVKGYQQKPEEKPNDVQQ